MDKTSIIRICGVDPGTRLTGVSIVDVSYPSFEIVNLEYLTIDSEIPIVVNNQHSNFNPVDNRIINIYKQLLDILNFYSPTDVVCESPFFNHRSPGAFGALCECFGSIKRAAFDYSEFVRFSSYPPCTCKKAVNVKSVKNSKELTSKEIVRIAIETLKLSINVDYSKMNEHEIDSFAVAIAHIERIKVRPYLLLLS